MINPLFSEQKPSNATKRQALEATHKIVSSELKSMQKKLKKMNKLCKNTQFALNLQQIKNDIQSQQQLEAIDTTLQLDLTSMQKVDSNQKAKFETVREALGGLSKEVSTRIQDVHNQTDRLKQSAYEWQASHNILLDSYERFLYQYYEKLSLWNEVMPVLNTWLNSEGQLQRSIYASAWLFGLQTELNAQLEIKKLLEDYEETHYSRLTSIPASQLPTIKQLQEQRQSRSEAYDQLHWRFLKQLRLMVKQCDYLQLEIESREHIRARLKSLTVEFFNALEEDVGDSHSVLLSELARSLGQILTTVLNLPGVDKKEVVEYFMPLTSLYSHQTNTIHPNTFENLSFINNPQTPPDKERYKINPLDTNSLVSSLSDEEELEIISLSAYPHIFNKHLTYHQLSGHYSHPHSTARFTPEVLNTINIYQQVDKVLNNKSKPYRAFKTLSSQTRDFKKNMERIHTQFKPCLDTINKYNKGEDAGATESEKGSKKIDETQKPSNVRDSKDAMLELLIAKRVVRKLQNATFHTAKNCIDVALDSKQEIIAKDFAARYKDSQQEQAEMQSKRFGSFHKAKSEMETWMEAGIIDKYKVALSLVQTELTKHDIPIPASLQQSNYNAATKVDPTISPKGNERKAFPSDTNALRRESKEQGQSDAGGNGSTQDNAVNATSMSQRLHSEQSRIELTVADHPQEGIDPSTSLEDGEEQFRNNTEQILLAINKQMSMDYEELMRSKRSKAQTVSIEQQEYEKEVFEDAAPVDSIFESENPMEMIMEGRCYHIHLILKSSKTGVYFVARNFVDKEVYYEYFMDLPLDLFSEVTGLPAEIVLHYIVENRSKFYQHIKLCFHIETIAAKYYDDLVDMLVLREDKYTYSMEEIEEMIRNYRESIPNAELRKKQAAAEQMEYGYLLQIVTLKTKRRGLLQYAFAQQKRKP